MTPRASAGRETAPDAPRARGLRAAIAALVCAAALLGVWAVRTGSPRPAGAGSATNFAATTGGGAGANDGATRAAALRAIEPALRKAEQRNDIAADRAVERLRVRFAAFRAGAGPFAEDMASWSTRLGVLRRLPEDWWASALGDAPDPSVGLLPKPAGAVGEYVRAKFQKHVIAPGAAEGAIADALAGAAEDLAASRNLLWADVGSALRSIEGAALGEGIDAAALESRFTAEAARLAERHAGATLGAGVGALVVSGAGSFVVEQAAAAILSRIGAGAAGGAFAGPAGVVVGVGLGIVVGFAIDWWMTEQYIADLRAQVESRIDDLERSVIDGKPATQEAEAVVGVREAVRAAARACDAAQRAAAMRAIEGFEP